MTIRIDVDDDGTTDAKVPLKWAVVALTTMLAACGLSRFVLV